MYLGLNVRRAILQTLSHGISLQLLYHLYTQPRSDDLELRYFVPDDIREELQRRSETVHMAPVPGLNLPEDLQDYHSLAPLEPVSGDRRKFGSWHSAVYRAVNSKDGQTYVLRRIESKFKHIRIHGSHHY